MNSFLKGEHGGFLFFPQISFSPKLTYVLQFLTIYCDQKLAGFLRHKKNVNLALQEELFAL